MAEEEEGSSWDVVSEDDILGVVQTEDDYVVVREEDIADGIACFMATYLSSLKQTKVRSLRPILVSVLFHVCVINLFLVLALCRIYHLISFRKVISLTSMCHN